MRPLPFRSRALACALPILLATTGATPGGPMGGALDLPPIVLVSRGPVPGEPGAIPGLGPHHRAVVTGGRLLVRDRDGRWRELLPRDAFLDVSDPSVSPAAHRIAFAGVTGADSAWRIWVVGIDGSDLRQVTFDGTGADGPARTGSAATRVPRFDDLDPCWTSDSTLVFASTRDPRRAQYADVWVTNLFTTSVGLAPGRERAPRRITAERNGAEEPAMDWTRGRLLFSRWWFNRYRAADGPEGITTDPGSAIARDTVNLWQTMELSLSVPRPRLAAGDLRTRRGTMGYQPTALAEGAIAAVYAANLGLSPRPGGTGVHALSRSFAPARRLAGAIVSGRAGDAYGGTEGLAPPSACSPAGLPDGRVLFSYSPGAGGDFGLFVMNPDGSRIRRVLDLPGTLELDANPILPRRAPPSEAPLPAEEYEDPEAFVRGGPPLRGPSVRAASPPAAPAGNPGQGATFRFHDLDVFADGPPGSPARGAAPRTAGARIRFFATLARPGREGGDTAILVRVAPVGPNGEVNERGLPADTPLFEQLVGPDGRVLMTAHGPAHVAGFNAGAAGFASRCVGCHLGHSTLPLAATATRAKGAGR